MSENPQAQPHMRFPARHDVGHYWDRLAHGTDRLAPYRELFGDERDDHAQALERHYPQGPRLDCQAHFVSAYASSHPWEDWAERPEAARFLKFINGWVRLATLLNEMARSMGQSDF